MFPADGMAPATLAGRRQIRRSASCARLRPLPLLSMRARFPWRRRAAVEARDDLDRLRSTFCSQGIHYVLLP